MALDFVWFIIFKTKKKKKTDVWFFDEFGFVTFEIHKESENKRESNSKFIGKISKNETLYEPLFSQF